MLKKTCAGVLFLSMLLSYPVLACAEEINSERETLFDFIKKPVKAIFRPIESDGLIDLILDPAEAAIKNTLSLGSVAQTPARTKEYVYNINKSVSVLGEDRIETYNPKDVQTVIAKEPGIVVNRYFGNPKDNSIDMRGFGEAGPMNYVLLVDGRRTNQIDLAGADLSQVDVSTIDRIEIINGASSVLYGDNATGGVINVITKRGKEDEFKLQYNQDFGSYQYQKSNFSVSGGHEFVDFYFDYSYQDTDGYRLNNGYEANNIFTGITLKPVDWAKIHFSAGYHKDWYGQPGALYDGSIVSDGREGSRFPNDKAKTEDYFFSVTPQLAWENTNYEVVLSTLMSYRSRRVNSVNKGFNVYEVNHHIKTYEVKPKLEVKSDLFDGKVENKLILGMDYFYAKDQILSGDTAFTKSQVDIIKETFGIYAYDSILINNHITLSGGIRGEWAEYVFDQFQPAASYNTQSPREIAYDAGMGYKYNDTSQVYFDYSRSFRLPATDELFTSAYESFDWWTSSVRVFPAVLRTDIKHQVGNNYEIGIKDNSFDNVKLNAAYYLIDNKNEIYYDPITFQNENYHHVIHHGLELSARANFFEKVNAYFTYNFQKSYFVDGKFASNNVPLVPKTKITAGFDAEIIDDLIFDFTMDYLGSRYIASDQMNMADKLKPHVTIGIGLAYEYKWVKIFARIDNLLNEKYYFNATRNWQGNPAFYPAPVRNYTWGMSLTF